MILVKTYIKTLILFFAIYAQLVCYAQGSWERIGVPIQQNLNSVYFTDSLTGWAVGDSGAIINTLDGGETWMIQTSNTTNDIVDLYFLNSKMGWASSFNYTIPPFGTIILKTINGGMDWVHEPYPDENIFINTILFLDSLTGWMGGSPHALVSTIDGGNSWQHADIDTSTLAFFPVLDIKFYNEQYGYASGGIFDIAGVTWRTSDCGEKWYAIEGSDAPADEIHELYLLDSLNVIGAGGDPDFGYGVGMLRTMDGGYNWEYDEIGIQGNAYDIDFVNTYEVWAPLGPRQKFIYSVDTGATWIQIPTPELTSIFDVMFTDSLHGYAVGDNGAMLKFKPAPPVSIVSNSVLQTNITLYQNYPNPTKGITIIKFELPTGYDVGLTSEIKVFNVLGIVVAVLNKANSVPGINQISFNATDLPDGLYHYQLVIGGKVISTKQMMLMQ